MGEKMLVWFWRICGLLCGLFKVQFRLEARIVRLYDRLQQAHQTIESQHQSYAEMTKSYLDTQSELAQFKAAHQRFQEALDLIGDIAEEYAGWSEAPALKKLIEDLKAIARKATDTNDPMCLTDEEEVK